MMMPENSLFAKLKQVKFLYLGIVILLAIMGLMVFAWLDYINSPEAIYIANITDSSFSVYWKTSSASASKVMVTEVGNSPFNSKVYTSEGANKLHEVNVSNLKPATSYKVQIAGQLLRFDTSAAPTITSELRNLITTPITAYGKVKSDSATERIILFTSKVENNPLTYAARVETDGTYAIDVSTFPGQFSPLLFDVNLISVDTDVRGINFTSNSFSPLQTIVLNGAQQATANKLIKVALAEGEDSESAYSLESGGEGIVANPSAENLNPKTHSDEGFKEGYCIAGEENCDIYIPVNTLELAPIEGEHLEDNIVKSINEKSGDAQIKTKEFYNANATIDALKDRGTTNLLRCDPINNKGSITQGKNGSHPGIDIGAKRETPIYNCIDSEETVVFDYFQSALGKSESCLNTNVGFSKCLALNGYKGHYKWGDASYGNYIVLRHKLVDKTASKGFRYIYTIYGHLTAESLDWVAKYKQESIANNRILKIPLGAQIATVNTAGNSSGPHLHFEARKESPASPSYNYISAGIEYGAYNDIYYFYNRIKSPFTKSSVLGVSTVPEVKLTSGVYSIKGDKITEKTVVVENNEASIFYFEDKNGNGTRDQGEDLLDEKLAGANVEKVSDVLTYKLNPGWNLISIPMTVEGVNKASHLAQLLASQGVIVTRLATFRKGNWQTLPVEYKDTGEIQQFGQDFELQIGEGYFVKVANSGTLHFEGQKYTPKMPVFLENGWNLIGLYNENTNYTSGTAISELSKQGFSADVITKFESGIYQSYISSDGGNYGNEFPILTQQGYFVRIDNGGGKYLFAESR
jgi:murein DD-endopeptidase MepM/ murein hydrolase activator NlpD